VIANASLFDSLMPPDDPALRAVGDELLAHDPDGSKVAGVLRRTYDMLLDGQHTGRYRWDQLYKTQARSCTEVVVTIGPFTSPLAVTRRKYPGRSGRAGMAEQKDHSDMAPWTSTRALTGRRLRDEPADPAMAADATMQPKLWPMRWNLAAGTASCNAESSCAAPLSPKIRARCFICQNVSTRNGASTPPRERPSKAATSSCRQAVGVFYPLGARAQQ
jgi:hypothetical protein